jgi:anti-sigma-K factor RskA
MMLWARSKTRLVFELQQHPRVVAGDLDRNLALAGLVTLAVVAGLLRVNRGGIAAAHLVAALAAHGFNVDLLVVDCRR